jgi:hypothetical protein
MTNMDDLTDRQRELILEALEWYIKRTRELLRNAGVRQASTKPKHQETLRELRVLIEKVTT